MGTASSIGGLSPRLASAGTDDGRIAEPAEQAHHTLSVSMTGRGTVNRTPKQPVYTPGTPVDLIAVASPGYRFGGWTGDATDSQNPIRVIVNRNLRITAAFIDIAPPTVRVDHPNQGGTLLQGQPADLRWSASDNEGVVAVDVLLSRSGAAGPFETLATGLPNTGSFTWTVTGPRTNTAVLKVVVRDAVGFPAEDLGNRTFGIKDMPDYPITMLRADSALWNGPAPVPGAQGPWSDLVTDHDAWLYNFQGTLASGWKGDGSLESPHRLEFGNEDRGYTTLVGIPAGSIPELQSLNPVTASVWFKTGWNGHSPLYEYVLEWVEHPNTPYDSNYEGRGMSIAVSNGKIIVYHDPWIEVATVQPNTWYNVAVAKDTNYIRVYLNGQPVYQGTKPHMGVQESELVLGCATFRRFEGYTGSSIYSDFWTGSIAQMELWRGARSDSSVLASFRADSARYLPNLPVTAIEKVVELSADRANGTGPHPSLSNVSPWVDLLPGHHDASLDGFAGDNTSGWLGNGTTESPYRLQFDGVDDRVAIGAGTVPELQTANALTAEVWMVTGNDVSSSDYQQVLEWMEGFGGSPGMSIAIQNGMLQSYFATPYWVELAPVEPNHRYHVVVAKEPGEVRVYLDGQRVFTGVTPNFGTPSSEIVLGASTWRGPGRYGEFFEGALTQVNLWRGALTDEQVVQLAPEPPIRNVPEGIEPARMAAGFDRLSLEGVFPNPASSTANVAFVLPSNAAATIELLDISGRRVQSHSVGSLGAGRHAIDLAAGTVLPAGNYVVRLTQGGRSLTTKATILR